MPGKVVRKVRKDLKLKTVIIVALVVSAVVFAGVYGVLHYYNSNIIGDNVYVNSLHVGGLTVDEATAKIDKEFSTEYFDKAVQCTYDDKTYEIDLLNAVKVDAEKTAKAALEKSSGFRSIFVSKENIVVPFELIADEAVLEEGLTYFCSDVEDEYGVYSFNDDYTTVSVDASKVDEIMDIKNTVALVLENVMNDKYDVVIPVMMKKDDKGYAEELYNRLNRKPKDASVGMNDDESTYIIPEVVGINADKNTFLKLYEENDGVFGMDVKPSYPDVRTTDLDIEFYQDVLGTYTSKYDVGLVNRTKNVSLATRFVNGTVVMPGKRFSYNSVVGKRTYERGFVDATVYTGEGTEEGIGGGICQVSSTIYCAQLRANLKTIARTNHSYTVVYVPLGQDATVVYGAIDYIFENDTNYPIRIDAVASGGYLTVKIMGTKVDKSLTYDAVSVTNSTIAKQEVQKETPDLPLGKTQVKQNGQNGAVVSTYKVYYKDGIEQKREFIGTSKYIPMNKILMVGTGEAEEDVETDTSVDTETVEPDKDLLPEDAIIPEDTEDVDGEQATTEEEPEITDLPTSDTGL